MTNHPPATGATNPGPFPPGTTLTLAEIAELRDKDIKTVKTWRAAGRWPNAAQDAAGRRTWRVPVTDLVAAGDLDPAHVAQVETELAARRESRETRALREQLIRLEEQLAAAHRLAEERAGTIDLLRLLLGAGGAV